MKVLSIPLMQEFALKSDLDGEAKVVVRQATEGENRRVMQIYAQTERILEDTKAGEQVRLRQEVNVRDLRLQQAYYTLASVTGITDENGQELFKTAEGPGGQRVKRAMTEEEFTRQWDKLPARVVNEIVEYILQVNLMWAGGEEEEGE